jgi:Fe2+ or Zn2+ uptake regulation protein
MGEASEIILNGLLCEQCGQVIDWSSPGYPRTCKECDPENGIELNNTEEQAILNGWYKHNWGEPCQP